MRHPEFSFFPKTFNLCKLFLFPEKVLKNSLHMFLQPQYDLASEKIVGAEALVRWVERGKFALSPEQFIPVLEKRNLIHQLDLFMFEQVCQFSKTLASEGYGEITLSVNMSRITLLNPNLPSLLDDLLMAYDVWPHQIEIEITESARVSNIESVAKQIRILKQKGFSLACDDFDTGNSSLLDLKLFDWDTIKLDKSFFQESLAKVDTFSFYKNLVTFFHQLGFKVIAEGVETEETSRLLKYCDCDQAQGYYYSEPLSKDLFLYQLFYFT